MNSFEVNKEKKVIMYGAASIGMLAFSLFEDNGIHIVGYIDKRADEMDSFMSRPVWAIENAILDDMMTDDYFVFVSVKNVFEHTNISNDLVRRGFNNIIFRPFPVLNGKGTDEQEKISIAYDLMEKGEFKKNLKIPKTVFCDIYEPRNVAIISEKKDFIVANVSIDLLHTDQKKRHTPWFDKSIMALLPHIELFRFVGGDLRYSIDRYMKFCISSASNTDDIVVSDAWKSNVIKNRSSIYEHMNQSMELDWDFFIRNAPSVIWNEKGYFNLNSGKHRAAYFASKRRKYIPLKINREDYKKWINDEKEQQVAKELQIKAVTELVAPIPHPFFYQYPCESKEFYYNFLYDLVYYLADDLMKQTEKLPFEQLNILCCLFDLGFIERALMKMECKVTCAYCEKEKVINEKLDKMMYCHSETKRIECIVESFDIAIFDLSREDICWENVININCEKKIVISNKKLEKIVGYNIIRLFSSIIRGKTTTVYLLQQ